MKRSTLWAKALGAALALTLTGSGATAEEATPNALKAVNAFTGNSYDSLSDGSVRFGNGLAGEVYADTMVASMSIQREFRRALPSIYSYNQTAHYQNRADIGSDSAFASTASAEYTYAVCPTTLCAPGKKWVMWDVPFLMHETRKRDGALGYKNSSSGFATGISRMLGESSAVGLAIGYDARKLTGRDGYHMRNRGDTLHMALYGGTNLGHFFIDGYAGWSRTWNRTERGIPIAADNAIYKANFKDDVFSAGLKASYVWILRNDTRITPSVGLDFSHVRLNSFTERSHTSPNNALYAQNVGTSKYNNLALPVMVSANRTFGSNFLAFKGAQSLWTPEVRAGWTPQFGSRTANTKTRFASNGNSFSVSSAEVARHYGTVGAGLKIKLADKYIFAVEYDYTFAKKYTNHSVTAMYGVSF